MSNLRLSLIKTTTEFSFLVVNSSFKTGTNNLNGTIVNKQLRN